MYDPLCVFALSQITTPDVTWLLIYKQVCQADNQMLHSLAALTKHNIESMHLDVHLSLDLVGKA